MDIVKLQYLLYIVGSLCFLGGSLVGLAKDIFDP